MRKFPDLRCSLQECEGAPMQISAEDWLHPMCVSACSATSGVFIREVEEDEESIPAPPFSPISELDDEETRSNEETRGNEDDVDNEEFEDEPLLELLPANLAGSTSAHSNQCSSQLAWHGYKLVGDNIDKDIRASFQRLSHTTQSLHYFHVYAVLDRVDFSGLSDLRDTEVAVDPLTLLPSKSDVAVLKKEMSTIISR